MEQLTTKNQQAQDIKLYILHQEQTHQQVIIY